MPSQWLVYGAAGRKKNWMSPLIEKPVTQYISTMCHHQHHAYSVAFGGEAHVWTN